MSAADPARQERFSLSGFSGKITEGACVVVSFDPGARRRRAWAGLGYAWGVAALCVFIPVAHFLLVPSFLLFGIYQFFDRLRTAELTRDARGTCPDCGTEQAFELGRRRHTPVQVTCVQCHRGLTVNFPTS
jgi:hypothetical protein